MQSHTHNFLFYPNFNFAVENVFIVQNSDFREAPPPPPGNFRLLDGTDFLLLDGTNFLLL